VQRQGFGPVLNGLGGEACALHSDHNYGRLNLWRSAAGCFAALQRRVMREQIQRCHYRRAWEPLVPFSMSRKRLTQRSFRHARAP
jgi:hypothetical protein